LFHFLSLFIWSIILITSTRLVTCPSHFFPNYFQHHLFWYPVPSFLKSLTLLLHLIRSLLLQLNYPTDISQYLISSSYRSVFTWESLSLFLCLSFVLPTCPLSTLVMISVINFSHYSEISDTDPIPSYCVLLPSTSTIPILQYCIVCPLHILPHPTSNLHHICTHLVPPYSTLDPVHFAGSVGVSASRTSVHQYPSLSSPIWSSFIWFCFLYLRSNDWYIY
jgi:hypothetical protein